MQDEVYFLKQILPNLTPNDIIVLNTLSDKTTPQLGISREEIQELLKKSYFNIFISINRLEFVNLISYLKVGKTNNYYITNLGLNALQILDE